MKALVINAVAGRADRLAAVLEQARGERIDAIFALGNLIETSAETTSPPDNQHAYTAIFEQLAAVGVPVYIIPGSQDTSVATMGQALRAVRSTTPLYLAHRAVAPLGALDVVAGFGGLLTTVDHDAPARLAFPAWEARVAFEHLAAYHDDFKRARHRIFLFGTPPAGDRIDRLDGQHVGVQLLNSLIRLYQPAIVCCSGPASGRGAEVIDGARVVNPGEVRHGSYAIVDLDRLDVRLCRLPEPIPTDAVAFRSIVVAIDGSPESWRALEMAAGLTRIAGAKLTLVYAFEPILRELGEPNLSRVIGERTTQGEALLTDAQAFVEDLAPELAVIEGPAADAIVRVAATHGADLIVMGARGLGGVRALLGSVSSRVLRQSHCPVLIARQPPVTRALAEWCEAHSAPH